MVVRRAGGAVYAMPLSDLIALFVIIYIMRSSEAMIYMTNPTTSASVSARQAGNKKPAYLAGFFGDFLALALRGSGGVASIRRSTSSVRGLGSCFMAGV